MAQADANLVQGGQRLWNVWIRDWKATTVIPNKVQYIVKRELGTAS